MNGRLLEVCVDDADGLTAAVEGGADRIELCAALDLGGLTPSPGLMRLGADCPVPVHAMIRPRAGGFELSEADVACMLRDIDAAGAAGLAGVVLGASRRGGGLDTARLERLAAAAGGLSLTLHRAFDLVPDVADAVEAAVALGFRRILTSGGAPRAPDGLHRLRETAAAADGRIVVMPGAGVTAATVGPLLAEPWCREVHASCRVPGPEPEPVVRALGFAAGAPRRTDRSAVADLKRALSA